MQLKLILTFCWLQILRSRLCFGKCLSTNSKNYFPTLVFTFSLNGGLNHTMLRLRFVFLLLRCSGLFGKCVNFSWNPLFFSAWLYRGAALLNSSALQDSCDILLLIIPGRLRLMLGGWFGLLLICWGITWFPSWPKLRAVQIKCYI